ncbi:MAG: zinc ribbon domain-containing protein [Clostridiales bacterium]|nr:zinc ribbon domain-containing protein [Clostridiales bacterium]
MKYCKSCGAELVDEAVVCPKCGVATGAVQAEPKQNTVGIVGLVLCFFAGSLIAFIVSLVGYIQGKKKGEKVGCALAGIIVSVVEFVLIIVLYSIVLGPLLAGIANGTYGLVTLALL